MLWYLQAPVSAPMLDLYSNTCKNKGLLLDAALLRRLQIFFLFDIFPSLLLYFSTSGNTPRRYEITRDMAASPPRCVVRKVIRHVHCAIPSIFVDAHKHYVAVRMLQILKSSGPNIKITIADMSIS